MTKQSGMNQRVYVDGYNISGDVQSFGRIGGGPAVLEFTGVDKLAYERKGGLLDGAIDCVTYFNPGTYDSGTPGETGSHVLLRPVDLTDRIVSVFDVQSSTAANLVAKQGNYDPTHAADGALTIAVNAMANGYGLEWCDHLTVGGAATHTGADQESGVDFAASSAFGLQAYLHVFDFTGTDATVKLQESSDNGAGDAWADVVGGAFTQITAGHSAERIETARNLTVERYLRVVTTTSAGFTSLAFAVSVAKNLTAVVF